jgi:hypothetical protein
MEVDLSACFGRNSGDAGRNNPLSDRLAPRRVSHAEHTQGGAITYLGVAMTVKANNSAAWLAEVEKRVARIKANAGESALHDAHELIAAAQILREELAIEASSKFLK